MPLIKFGNSYLNLDNVVLIEPIKGEKARGYQITGKSLQREIPIRDKKLAAELEKSLDSLVGGGNGKKSK